jgi:hypothetical protein
MASVRVPLCQSAGTLGRPGENPRREGVSIWPTTFSHGSRTSITLDYPCKMRLDYPCKMRPAGGMVVVCVVFAFEGMTGPRGAGREAGENDQARANWSVPLVSALVIR